MPPGFQVSVLGSHGGPVDKYTSAFMVKSAGTPWQRNCLLGVDCGSLVSGVVAILAAQQTNGPLHSDGETQPFPQSILKSSDHEQNAFHIVDYYLAGICITHEHLDHIAGLVINSTSFSIANPKHIFALESCITSLKNYVFNGHIWPNLTNEGLGALNFLFLNRLKPCVKSDVGAVNLKATPFPVSHGLLPSSTEPSGNTVYHSTAYVIEDQLTRQIVIIWGDVEPDKVSKMPRNSSVWDVAAKHYVDGLLSGMFIECSYPKSREDFCLFGHMNPQHLVQELLYTADVVKGLDPSRGGQLQGLKVYITHLKTDPHGHHYNVVDELRDLAKAQGLLCEFHYGTSGMTVFL